MTNYRRADHLSWQNLGEETIILDSRVNKEVHELNEVASFLWNHLDGSKTISELAILLSEEYDLDVETGIHDIQNFLHDLSQKSLIVS